MDLDNEELYYTRKQKGLIKENKEEYIKKLEETKNKLVRYIAIKEGKDYEQICREFEI